jgi:beta-glucosidase
MARTFPDGFTWGASTAAYQIEGAAFEDGRGESIWDRFSHTPGKVLNGDTGDVACDHYHRWPEDIAIMQQLGVRNYRMSIGWPRIDPNGDGRINEAGLAFYDRLVDGLIAAGIEPWITLYHWDLPQALQDRGGWSNRDTADRFAAYSDAVTRRLGDRVTKWMTINEPWVISVIGHLWGIFAPGDRSWQATLATGHNVLRAHGAAMPVIRANVPNAQAGIVLNLSKVYAASEAPADVAAARIADAFFNRWWLEPLAGRGYPADMLEIVAPDMPEIHPDDFAQIAVKTDFLAINNYSPHYIGAPDASAHRPAAPGEAHKGDTSAADRFGFREVDRPDLPRTGMGWLAEPRGLRDLLLRLQQDYPELGPYYVTENGAAYPDPDPVDGVVVDPDRTAYLAGHTGGVLDAIEGGAKVGGYFVWSLLDNFEWAQGYSDRFGIVHIDYGATLDRTIKQSGWWYRDLITSNRLP